MYVCVLIVTNYTYTVVQRSRAYLLDLSPGGIVQVAFPFLRVLAPGAAAGAELLLLLLVPTTAAPPGGRPDHRPRVLRGARGALARLSRTPRGAAAE